MLTVYLFTGHYSQSLSAPNETTIRPSGFVFLFLECARAILKDCVFLRRVWEGAGKARGSCAGAHRGVLCFGHFLGREGLTTFIPITLMRPQAVSVRPARDLKHIRFTPELRLHRRGHKTESTLGENIQYNSH